MQKHEDNLARSNALGALEAVEGATVTVIDMATGLPPLLYSDNGVTLIAGQIVTGSNGYYSFYAADGRYTLTFAGATIVTFAREILLEDPVDNPYASLAALAANGGSELVTFTHSGVGAVPRDLEERGNDVASVKDFGVVGDGVTDDTAALAVARAWLATTRGKLVFPRGTYKYSVSPNWAIHHAEVAFDGEVKLLYTGVGNAVIIDADGVDAVVFTSGLLYAFNFGWGNRPTIEAPTTAGHGVYVRSAHHCKIAARVRGCGTASAGLKVEFAVCTEFDVAVTVNEDAWYLSAKPAIGYDLDKRGAGETTSYCTFVNPIVEGPGIGIQLTATLGNTFWGGTAEGCATYGVFATTGANLDKFIGTDFEFNTTADIYCNGNRIVFDQCDSNSVATASSSAVKCQFIGGSYETLTLDAGSAGCTARDLIYNRSGTTGAFSDVGDGNRVSNLTYGGTAPYHDWEEDRYIEFSDDFLGDFLLDEWAGAKGSDASALAPALGGSVQNGYVRLIGGSNVGVSMATNGSQLTAGANQWRMDAGGFEMQFRVKLSDITNVAWFIGMTDQVAALEMPFTLAAGNVLTSNASDAFGILFDTDADTDQWALVGVANDVDATTQFSGTAPVANAYATWRIQVTSAGVARFYRNRVLVGTALTGATRNNILLSPVIAGFSRTTATKIIDCDYIKLRGKRA